MRWIEHPLWQRGEVEEAAALRVRGEEDLEAPVEAVPVDHVGGDAAAEAEAFVPVGGLHGLRRRTGPVSLDSSPRSGRAGDGRRSTFREDVGHAAAETYLVTGLPFTLLGYLG